MAEKRKSAVTNNGLIENKESDYRFIFIKGQQEGKAKVDVQFIMMEKVLEGDCIY